MNRDESEMDMDVSGPTAVHKSDATAVPFTFKTEVDHSTPRRPLRLHHYESSIVFLDDEIIHGSKPISLEMTVEMIRSYAFDASDKATERLKEADTISRGRPTPAKFRQMSAKVGYRQCLAFFLQHDLVPIHTARKGG